MTSRIDPLIERIGMALVALLPMTALILAPCLFLMRDDVFDRVLNGVILVLALWQMPPAVAALMDAVNGHRPPQQLMLFHDFLDRLSWQDGSQRLIQLENGLRRGLLPALVAMIGLGAALASGEAWLFLTGVSICLLVGLVTIQQWCAERSQSRWLMGFSALVPLGAGGAVMMRESFDASLAWGGDGIHSLVIGGMLCVYGVRLVRDAIRRSPLLKRSVWVVVLLVSGFFASLLPPLPYDHASVCVWGIWCCGFIHALAHERRQRADIKIWLLSLS